MARLLIASTWNGEPVAASEQSVVELTTSGATWLIEVNAPFHDDRPPAERPGALDGLWAFEVVELFVAAAGAADSAVDYTEVELSPHGHYLVLRFAGVRQRVGLVDPVRAHSRIRGDRWHGRIELPRAALPAPPWRANAFAVHGRGRRRRYLAAAPLPGSQPDFHQPGCFPPLTP